MPGHVVMCWFVTLRSDPLTLGALTLNAFCASTQSSVGAAMIQGSPLLPLETHITTGTGSPTSTLGSV